jgi:hypothetical protein
MHCLAVLTTEVKTAFHLKNQVLATFLDITRAYKKEGVPVPLVFLLWDMMCEKHLYFFGSISIHVQLLHAPGLGLFAPSVLDSTICR